MTDRDTDKKNGWQGKFSQLAAVWNIVGVMIMAPGLGYLAGWKLGDPATGALVGGFVGLFYCGYEIWKAVRRGD